MSRGDKLVKRARLLGYVLAAHERGDKIKDAIYSQYEEIYGKKLSQKEYATLRKAYWRLRERKAIKEAIKAYEAEAIKAYKAANIELDQKVETHEA